MKRQEEFAEDSVRLSKKILVLLVCLVVVSAVMAGTSLYRNIQTQQKYAPLEQLAEAVENAYYTDVDETAVMQGAMKGYVAGLDDPYSQYMTAEEYTNFMVEESGNMVGIGVTVTQKEEGYLLVNDVTSDSPAEVAGIQPADIIQQVDGQDVASMGYEEAVSAVKGEEGTSVELGILRDEKPLVVEVQRALIEVESVQGTILSKNIGYISIRSFKENTPEQFQTLYQEMLDSGVEGFVFDVRNNGGGLVNSLEKVLDPLLPEGTIAIATYRDGTTQTLVESDAESCELPMVVLVNENTASAAELFAASLHDFEKAELVGTTTFGKGIMQNTSSMPSGGALTLTVATYQTTRGECYHQVGITPDVEVQPGEEALDYEAPDPNNDPQLAAALEQLQVAR